MGLAYDNLGQYDRAIQQYEQALSISHEIGDQRNQGNWLNNIGALYDTQGDYPQAIAYYEQARVIYVGIGTLHLVERVNQRIAIVRAKLSGGT